MADFIRFFGFVCKLVCKLRFGSVVRPCLCGLCDFRATVYQTVALQKPAVFKCLADRRNRPIFSRPGDVMVISPCIKIFSPLLKFLQVVITAVLIAALLAGTEPATIGFTIR